MAQYNFSGAYNYQPAGDENERQRNMKSHHNLSSTLYEPPISQQVSRNNILNTLHDRMPEDSGFVIDTTYLKAADEETDPIIKMFRQLAHMVRNVSPLKITCKQKISSAAHRLSLHTEIKKEKKPDSFVCHLLIQGIKVASKEATTISQSRIDAFDDAFCKISMPYLRIVQLNSDRRELQASSTPFTNESVTFNTEEEESTPANKESNVATPTVDVEKYGQTNQNDGHDNTHKWQSNQDGQWRHHQNDGWQTYQDNSWKANSGNDWQPNQSETGHYRQDGGWHPNQNQNETTESWKTNQVNAAWQPSSSEEVKSSSNSYAWQANQGESQQLNQSMPPSAYLPQHESSNYPHQPGNSWKSNQFNSHLNSFQPSQGTSNQTYQDGANLQGQNVPFQPHQGSSNQTYQDGSNLQSQNVPFQPNQASSNQTYQDGTNLQSQNVPFHPNQTSSIPPYQDGMNLQSQNVRLAPFQPNQASSNQPYQDGMNLQSHNVRLAPFPPSQASAIQPYQDGANLQGLNAPFQPNQGPPIQPCQNSSFIQDRYAVFQPNQGSLTKPYPNPPFQLNQSAPFPPTKASSVVPYQDLAFRQGQSGPFPPSHGSSMELSKERDCLPRRSPHAGSQQGSQFPQTAGSDPSKPQPVVNVSIADVKIALIYRLATSLQDFKYAANRHSRLQKSAHAIGLEIKEELSVNAHGEYSYSLFLDNIILASGLPQKKRHKARSSAYTAAIQNILNPKVQLSVDSREGQLFLVDREYGDQDLEINEKYDAPEWCPENVQDFVLYEPTRAKNDMQLIRKSGEFNDCRVHTYYSEDRAAGPSQCHIFIGKEFIASGRGKNRTVAAIKASRFGVTRLKSVCWHIKVKPTPTDREVFTRATFLTDYSVDVVGNNFMNMPSMDSEKLYEYFKSYARSMNSLDLLINDDFSTQDLKLMKDVANNFNLVLRSNTTKTGYTYYSLSRRWTPDELVKRLQACGGEDEKFILNAPSSKKSNDLKRNTRHNSKSAMEDKGALDPEIRKLSQIRKMLWSKMKKSTDSERIAELKKERSRVLHLLRKKTLNLKMSKSEAAGCGPGKAAPKIRSESTSKGSSKTRDFPPPPADEDPKLTLIHRVAESLNQQQNGSAKSRLRSATLTNGHQLIESSPNYNSDGCTLSLVLNGIVLCTVGPFTNRNTANLQVYESAIKKVCDPKCFLISHPESGETLLATENDNDSDRKIDKSPLSQKKKQRIDSLIDKSRSSERPKHRSGNLTEGNSSSQKPKRRSALTSKRGDRHLPDCIRGIVLLETLTADTDFEMLRESAKFNDTHVYCNYFIKEKTECQVYIANRWIATAAGKTKPEASAEACRLAVKKLKGFCQLIKVKSLPGDLQVLAPFDFYSDYARENSHSISLDERKLTKYIESHVRSDNTQDLFFMDDFNPEEVHLIQSICQEFKLTFRRAGQSKDISLRHHVAGRQWRAKELVKLLNACGGENASFKLFPPGSGCENESPQVNKEGRQSSDKKDKDDEFKDEPIVILSDSEDEATHKQKNRNKEEVQHQHSVPNSNAGKKRPAPVQTNSNNNLQQKVSSIDFEYDGEQFVILSEWTEEDKEETDALALKDCNQLRSQSHEFDNTDMGGGESPHTAPPPEKVRKMCT